VFTSEGYGDAYAGFMGSVQVKVDQARAAVPCSGTAIRDDPDTNWEYLRPPARGWFAKRVCVLGAESTGTTTLAEALAAELKTVWVPEYGREYCEIKLTRGETEWGSDEFVHIAEEQTRREDAAARQANRVLVCDTNAFATALWHRRYLGTDEPRVRAIVAAGRCDLYLLTGDEIPFVQDGLRDGEAIRHVMHGWFAEELAQQPVPWKLLRGPHEERLRDALAAVESLTAAPA
jgi:NadR type nicotinamide-nucleotide adenylyltransferase